ncbi:MAG: hypothetical protein HY074_05230 [Deltaproteobacteria bacterium]|nr:hypothetical protein [Deltaproteobacteria bacterium]
MELFNPLEKIVPLQYRLYLAVLFFAVFGIYDWQKNPTNPKRAREYLFLFSVMALTIAFAMGHDLITANISKEYFTLGKGLPEQDFTMNLMSLAVQASYFIGLLVGMLFLVLNNPSRLRRQLPYTALYRKLSWPFFFSVALACFFGMLARQTFIGKLLYLYDMGALVEFKRTYASILVEMGLHRLAEALHVRAPAPVTPLVRPDYAFAVVHAAHWGTYLGAALGTLVAAIRIRLQRRPSTPA